MCVDDHEYCEVCGRHSVGCYCFIYNPPGAEEAPGVCAEHCEKDSGALW